MVAEVPLTLKQRFAAHNVLTYSSAIAFQTFVALVPLGLLALLLLGHTSLQSLWLDRAQPAVLERFPYPVYIGVEYTAEQILSAGPWYWIAGASALVVWEWSGAVRAAMGALNCIYGFDETRGIVRRFGLSFALGIGAAAAILTAALAVNLAGRIAGGRVPGALASAVAWALALVLLWAALLLLVRLAPAGAVGLGWLTLGSAGVIVAWVLVSIAFRLYVEHLANFHTPFGVATAFFVTSGYLYTSAIVFLAGVEVDEILRRRARR